MLTKSQLETIYKYLDSYKVTQECFNDDFPEDGGEYNYRELNEIMTVVKAEADSVDH